MKSTQTEIFLKTITIYLPTLTAQAVNIINEHTVMGYTLINFVSTKGWCKTSLLTVILCKMDFKVSLKDSIKLLSDQ